MPSTAPVCSGLVERIGLDEAVITHKVFRNGQELTTERKLNLPDHKAGLLEVVNLLTDKEMGVISNPDDIEVVGHRVVHGGESFAATTLITEAAKEEIKRLFSLAPLHNPSNYTGIEVAERIFPNAAQVAVFDTAFHQTMPEKAFRYAIPNELYEQEGIRAYGFHGTSHKYVTEQAAAYLENKNARIISIHLGNGCSMAALRGGKSVDTSMGFGPLSGLVMGTRSGDIDPSVIFYLVNQLNYTPEQVSTLLNKKSGMLGLSGYSDMRDIINAMEEGSKEATLAYDLYAYRIKKYIGSLAAVLNGVDAIVFTAGVGENDSLIREMVCEDMEYLGIDLDVAANKQRAKALREINTPDSNVKVLVIPTNEELEIAKQCFELLAVPVLN